MERYSFSARFLHWIMAIGFIFVWGCGYAMKSLVPDDSAIQEFLFGLHISIGVTLLFLLVARIVVRMATAVPTPLSALANWEKAASHLGHVGLYVLPVLIIFIGWAETDFGGHGVTWFGISMPKLFPTMETLWGLNTGDTTAKLHEFLAYTMLAVVVIHVAAVVKHRIEGRDVLKRMTFK